MLENVNNDHSNILLTYFNIKNVESSIIYRVKDGYIGLVNNNVMILNLGKQYRDFKHFNKIFDQFIRTLDIKKLYASSQHHDLLTSVGFIKRDNHYVYYTKHHNVLTLEYPYSKHFITMDDITNALNDIRNYNMPRKGNIITLDFMKERHMNRITDYFTDYCRCRCVFKGTNSPYDYYIKNKGKIVLQSLSNNEFDINKFECIMFNTPQVKFCNNFQVSLASTIYKMFNAKSVFDSSCGWGDRLIAAIALNITYSGTDPSQCLKPLYKKIIKTIGNKEKHKVYNIGIEELDTNAIEPVDLCFTSPPFFDLEVYDNNNDSQSIVPYKSLFEWEKGFLIPLAEKNISILKNKGYFAFYIPGNYYTVKYLNRHPQMTKRDSIKFYTPKTREIYVWQKN